MFRKRRTMQNATVALNEQRQVKYSQRAKAAPNDVVINTSLAQNYLPTVVSALVASYEHMQLTVSYIHIPKIHIGISADRILT